MEHVKIKLILLNGRAMTFSADDYIKLRTEHRIIGKLIGVSAPYPRNVNLQNLPAFYSNYETKLMIEENIADIYEKDLAEAPSEAMKETFKNHQKAVSEELQNMHMKNKLESTLLNMKQIIKGKRKKLMKSGVPENEINITPEQIIKEEEQRYRQTYNPQNLHSQIPTEHPFQSATKTVDNFPVSNVPKYRVFHDLWKKGFFVTNAENFGGDFLTYSGDPIYFHATQIVHIIDREEMLEPHFLISCGRLSVSVKKKCLFAYLDNKDSVVYQTFEWDNPKVRELNAVNQNKSELINEDENIT